MAGTKRRWAIGIAIGVPTILAATLMWLTRAPDVPSFVRNYPHEPLFFTVLGNYRRLAVSASYFNVKRPIDDLLREIERTEGRKSVEKLKGAKSYFIRYLDSRGPFLNVQLTEGRTTWSKSWFNYDNRYPDSFSEGWTSVLISYRPNVRSWLSSYWKDDLGPRLGFKPEPWKGVLATQIPHRSP